MSAPSGRPRKRLSLFRRPAPSPLCQTDIPESPGADLPKVLHKKERTLSWLSQPSSKSSDADSETSFPRKPTRLHIPPRGSAVQQTAKDDSEDALWSATSSQAGSFRWSDVASSYLGAVIHHGEVQTSSGIWRKTREYLVLTDNYLLRYKSQAKAANAFPMVPSMRRRHSRHGSSPALSSMTGFNSPISPVSSYDDFGDRSSRVELNRVLAVNNRYNARPYFALEVHWIDDDTNETRSLVFQLKDPEEKEVWLSLLLKQTKDVAGGYAPFIHPRHLFRIQEYDLTSDIVDPSSTNVFMAIRHSTDKSAQPNSPAALEKLTVNGCLVAIGSNRVHILPLTNSERAQSFGLVTLFGMDLAESDDSITFNFRSPLQPAQEVRIASLRSLELVCCIYRQLKMIRPHWQIKLCSISGPPCMRRRMSNERDSDARGLHAFSRTLTAYLVGYGRSPDAVKYRVNASSSGANTFQLLNPDLRHYNYLELLAVMRSLYYTRLFETISFADVCLDCLNMRYDAHGSEHIDIVQRKVAKSTAQIFDMSQESLLTQEIAAIASTNRNLLRLDFSNSIAAMSIDGESESGILQALYPICTRELTNVEWLSLRGIRLSGADLECLWLLADDRRAHLRGLDISRTGISQQKLTHLFSALKEQENTLESLNLSNNGACLNQCSFDMQIRNFPYLHTLDLSHLALSDQIDEPLIEASTFHFWRLRELNLSYTHVNTATIHSLCLYLQNPNSSSLKTLNLEYTGIGADSVAALMRSMTDVSCGSRALNLFVGGNELEKSHETFAKAVAKGLSPTFLSISKTDYQEQSALRAFFNALKINRTTVSLKADQIRLFASPHLGDETLGAIQLALAKNQALERVDLSGNYSDPSNVEGELNPGIKHALIGLCNRRNLRVVKLNNQKLYYEGAFMLAEIIRNNPDLVEVHCEHSNITLAGFDELLRAIKKHNKLQYMSNTEDSKFADLDELEESMFKTKLEATPSKARQVFTSVEGKFTGRRTGKQKRPSIGVVLERNSDDEITIRNWDGKQALLNQYLERNQRIARGEPAEIDAPTHSAFRYDEVTQKMETRGAHGENQNPIRSTECGIKPCEKDAFETKSNASTDVSTNVSNDGNGSDGLYMKFNKI